MDYRELVRYIRSVHSVMERELIAYLNGCLFEKDVDKLMILQSQAGEDISIEFAAKCVIDREADTMYDI